VERYADFCAVSRECLIHGVIDDLPQAVHQTALVGRPNVHTGPFTNCFETLENTEVAGGIVVGQEL
jgi:hypothetical protein